ncbi:hypothetical protein LCGC14_1833900 [marine sediment metagenome]|uniref:7-cyano-7-deazaguanine synthase n=1 Tax=marine sediment metagenome TaxID=412755 RepID=A0A0F9JEQ3_9ZZZZ
MSGSVVLLSGGLDSAVTAWIAKREKGRFHHNRNAEMDLYALSLRYGQAHSREIESAIQLGHELGVKRHLELNLPLHAIGGSSLFNREEIPTEGLDSGVPSTWVPQRNAVFLALAFGWAEVVGADRVYVGVNAVDYSGYPDCRPEFVEAMAKALNLASKQFVETGSGIQIVTPIIDLTKKEIVQMGLRLGVPFQHTWSCYKGGELACGVCDSCRIRLAAWKALGKTDPIRYAQDIEAQDES